MKRFRFVIFMLVLWSCKTSNHNLEFRKVKIVLDTEEPLNAADTIYIIGNQPELGQWQSIGLPMARRAETRWEKTFNVADSTPVEFKFTLGSLDQEAISNRGVIPGNSLIQVVRDTEVYFVIEDFKMPKVAIDSLIK